VERPQRCHAHPDRFQENDEAFPEPNRKKPESKFHFVRQTARGA
jgi:hypothetical protein